MSLFKRAPKATATITYVSASGARREVPASIGSTLMEAAVNGGVEGIVAECGGSCMCATCHVYVDETHLDRLEAMDEREDEMLAGAFAERKSNSRLSCQVRITEALNGIVVATPEAQQ